MILPSGVYPVNTLFTRRIILVIVIPSTTGDRIVSRKEPHKLVAINIRQHEALMEEAAKERRSLTNKLSVVIDEHLEKQGALNTDAIRG